MMNEQDQPIRVAARNGSEVIRFAADELVKYLRRMLGDENLVVLTEEAAAVPSSLRLGLFAEFPGIPFPAVADPALDDAIFVQVVRGRGIIAGINPRSVLLAVYRFLTELGCRWVRPGPGGELIPARTPAELTANLNERPACRHRGVCIEGAVGEENVRAIVDWLPKVGMNAYFIQFREGFAFFERWYAHRRNARKTPEEFDVGRAREIVGRIEAEIRRRGLLYHAVGHGWTCEPLGIPGLSWEQRVEEAPATAVPFLAQVNGERRIWEGIPLNTNLCYSNPEVREMIVSEIARYLREHPAVDFLHFWLADGFNNHCECPACREALPADFYVQILNELDARLTGEESRARIVFLIYVDLLWPPRVRRLRNPDRFVLMFAPITRSYGQSFAGRPEESDLEPYVRNRLRFPSSAGENLAYLRAWQRVFAGDSFDFDYHLMWAHYFDPGHFAIAGVIHQDVRSLKEIGLNGLISCQVQRAFMPTGLPMAVMARTLWNQELSFEEIAEDYFLSAFGEDGDRCRELLAGMPNLLDELDIWSDRPPGIGIADKLERIARSARQLSRLVEKNKDLPNECQAQSWRYLGIYLEILLMLAQVLSNGVRGKKEEALALWQDLQGFVCEAEDEIQPVFDVFEFIETVEKALARM